MKLIKGEDRLTSRSFLLYQHPHEDVKISTGIEFRINLLAVRARTARVILTKLIQSLPFAYHSNQAIWDSHIIPWFQNEFIGSSSRLLSKEVLMLRVAVYAGWR